jgi:peptidyl-prolyl cis-trans isomerase A (cyclophilin A)
MRLSVGVAIAVLTAAPQVVVTQTADATRSAPSTVVRIRIETEKGVIEAELDSAKAPRTVANFLAYVEGGAYEQSRFHRTVRADNQPNDSVRIAVIQASVDSAHTSRDATPIALERTSVTGLRHLDGTLSMARGGPDTATSSFFVCIGDQPSLDFGGHRNVDGQGFAAFGRVTRGMEVVRAIQTSPAEGQRLTPPIAITRIVRIRN